jgi:siderophore synthetase component
LTDNGIPAFRGRPVDVPASTYSGAANGRDVDFSQSEVWSTTATLDHEFSDTLRLHNAFRYYDYTLDRQNTIPNIVNEAARTVTLYRQSTDRAEHGWFNQLELSGTFSTGPLEHKLLLGFEAGRQSKYERRIDRANIATVDLFNPVLPVLPLEVSGSPGTHRKGVYKTLGFYAQDMIALGEHWKVLAGLRHDRFRQEVHQRIAGQPDLARTDTFWSPRMGLVWQPTPAQSYYVSWNRSYQPSGETFALSTSSADIAPEKTINCEIGAKFDLFDGKLSATISAFNLKRSDIKATDPVLLRVVPVGVQRTRGIEASAQMELAEGWQAIASYAYLADCLVRENYREIALGTVIPAERAPFDRLIAPTDHYLAYEAADGGTLFMPVEPDGFMQTWRVCAPPFVHVARQGARLIDSVTEFLEIMKAGLEGEDSGNVSAFLDECQAAIEQGVLCDAAARDTPPAAMARLAAHPEWHRAMLANDRLASFIDHPFYPTARAKHGFAADDLIAYGPEYQQSFRLAWLALPKDGLSVQGDVPALWPSFADVGLNPALEHSHALLPVHPFMRGERMDRVLAEAGISDRAYMAPRDFLEVVPTLSVRALAVVEDPGLHIKLPLAISTLGRLNLRAIKPVTINDGHVVHSLLEAIRADDAPLRAKLLLTDESGGAHHAGERFLAYIVRRYPEGLDGCEPVPVTALMAPMPDGRPYALHLADRYYRGDVERFLGEFCDLLLSVHLRLAARYGIELEANQQNSLVLFDRNDGGLRLLLKDNDSPRIDASALLAASPGVDMWIGRLQDARIAQTDTAAIAQMLITITIQLNLGAVIEGLGRHLGKPGVYRSLLRTAVERHLDRLAGEGIAIGSLRTALLEAHHFPIKYLLRAATLETRKAMGAADVNKAYGHTAPNFLLGETGR